MESGRIDDEEIEPENGRKEKGKGKKSRDGPAILSFVVRKAKFCFFGRVWTD